MANMIPSQALYFDDPYCTEFNATITLSTPKPGGGFVVTLDKTYFYPTSGGQDHDTGTICDTRVIDVIRDENTWVVKHVVETGLPTGPASCKIDWEHRLRNMQHHSGQHLLTQSILRLLGFKTISANINGYTPSTLDIVADRLLNDSEIEAVEELANQIIFENRSIKTYFVAAEDIEKVPLRRPPKVSENIRIVEIDGFDYSACGGTHCAQTGAIGIIKILKSERINNKTRVHFIAGFQALHQFRNYHNTITALTSHLNANTKDLTTSVIRLIETTKNVQKEYQELLREKLVHEAHALVNLADINNGKRFIQCAFENRSANELRILADILKAQNEVIALLTSYDGKRLSVIVTCGHGTQADAKEILRQILSYVGGNGGGDPQIAQGGGPIAQEDLDRLLDSGIQAARKLI
ncbi:MAG: hypothetical protein A2029_01970 [Chloroflexi bacterium RBG_19FT_COMBO_47_9]|nr:MAG: hypothetical protein A2029_01970 [Chloroflexi bacterium RBG_19FT_COMBO_47_9]